jgi:threonylcarbamoyladenosine tRNA methylthiotransferase MtaB
LDKTVAECTLGCKVNRCDTDALLEALTGRGYTVTDFNKPADIYLINTCTVTHIADRKSRQMIRRARKLNPGARVAVCGCLSNISKEAVREAGADFAFNSRDVASLLAWLSGSDGRDAGGASPGFDAAGVGDEPEASAGPAAGRVRAYIKIQEGCDRYCAYCIVPYARGRVVSRAFGEVLAVAENLVARGYKEIVLTGIHAASYGKDSGKPLPELMAAVAKVNGLRRLRLSSIEPCAAEENFLRAVAENPKICGHFHLSLQSGCDATLKRMNRRYTAREYAEAAARLREVRNNAALTTDVIVGFPGEMDADFEESLRFVERVGFARAHVFEYSPRAGTPAAGFENQIPPEVKNERGERMRRLTANLERGFLRQNIGSTAEVLFETNKSGFWEGHTENYIKVRAEDTGLNLWNELVTVRLKSADEKGAFITGKVLY